MQNSQVKPRLNKNKLVSEQLSIFVSDCAGAQQSPAQLSGSSRVLGSVAVTVCSQREINMIIKAVPALMQHNIQSKNKVENNPTT